MPLFGLAGERIAYAVHPGPAGSPPLLLLHGFTASSVSWVSNLPGLSERFTVITVDLLGHGDSDAPDDPDLYGPAAAVARLARLLDQLGHDEALVCGHSLGGALALRFALDFPERVAGLVVLNSNSAAGTPEWRENARQGMEAMAAKARAEGTAFLRETRLYPANGSRLPADARALLVRDFDRLTPAGFAGTAESLVVDVNSFERLGSLSVPALVVIGDRDRDFVQSAPRFVVRMPRDLVETFTIEGGGHAANLEQPALFNEALFAFAERIGFLAPLGADPGGPATVITMPSEEEDAPGDDDLGPTLYQEFAESMRSRGRQIVLTTLGGGLILSGAALLVAAFVYGGGDDNEGRVAAEANNPTATPTVIERAAGVRTPGDATPNPTPAGTVAGEAPSLTPSASPTSAAAPATQAVPTSTPRPAQPTPTAGSTEVSSPTPAPTSTPTGPSVAIAGPSTAAVGQPVTFVSVENPEAIRRDWTASNGTAASISPTFTTAFAAPGCYTVSVTALFAQGSRSTSSTIAVGGAACP